MGDRAHLIVEAGASLTISADSSLGTAFLELNGDPDDTADLIIAGTLSIGAISSQYGIRLTNGRILPVAGQNPTLTFVDENDDTDPPTIRGYGEISVKLISDGVVQATTSGETLWLTGGEKQATYETDGSGQWQARDGGVLRVDCQVSGSGKWLIDQGIGQSEIVVDHCQTELAGDVEALGGKITFNASFCTSGQVRYKNTTVTVQPGKSTKYGSACPAGFCP
ncbi:MAG: hypothetical protein C4547_14870 [Phycisphaerales bacterium]|nr:MAG: hypothetical protein C4547_14870 [Phycisphaerales bacterium]